GAAGSRTTGIGRLSDRRRPAIERLRAEQLLVDDLDADVEALGHVPLQPGADAPERPVVVAARGGDRRRSGARAVAAAHCTAKDGIGSRAVALRHVGADERLVPLRRPVMLVTGV